jgi:hypothetical protein
LMTPSFFSAMKAGVFKFYNDLIYISPYCVLHV